MRKASKATIRAAMSQYLPWRARVDARIGAIGCVDARPYLTEWADDVRGRIEAGEVGPCTQALIQSVERDLRAWETGYYVSMTSGGGRKVA